MNAFIILNEFKNKRIFFIFPFILYRTFFPFFILHTVYCIYIYIIYLIIIYIKTEIRTEGTKNKRKKNIRRLKKRN